jgi:hypothetical protein
VLLNLSTPVLDRYRDTESATWSIYGWLIYSYMIGSSLEGLEADSLLYCKQMKALKRDHAAYVTKSLRQVFLNLMGRENGDNPTRFSGESFSIEEFEQFRDDNFIGSIFFAYHGILFTYFGEYVHYADLVLQKDHDHLQKAHCASANNMWDTYLKGVCCFAAAQETRQRKYAKMGQIFRSKIKSWLNKGNPNVSHYKSLLEAEWAAFKGNRFGAIRHYELAILWAARNGYLHDAGLATERFGTFYWTVLGDREHAAYQIGQSIKYWGEWGAVAKVRHLQEKFAHLLPGRVQLEGVVID